MTSNKFGYYQNKYEVVVRFNDSSAKTKWATILLGMVLVVAAAAVLFSLIPEKVKILIQAGYSPYLSFCIIPFYIAIPFLHELIHFVSLWSFSRQKPQSGFEFPYYIYIKLRSNASISRIEGLISYLLPFLVITIIFIVIALFVKPIVQVVLITLGIMHAPICSADFLSSFRLLRCRGEKIRLAHENCEAGFDTVFFRDKYNK